MLTYEELKVKFKIGKVITEDMVTPEQEANGMLAKDVPGKCNMCDNDLTESDFANWEVWQRKELAACHPGEPPNCQYCEDCFDPDTDSQMLMFPRPGGGKPICLSSKLCQRNAVTGEWEPRPPDKSN